MPIKFYLPKNFILKKKLKIYQTTNTNSLLLLICLQHCLHYAPCNGAATYVCNFYAASARLFIFGRGEILPKEGINQGDPTSMGVYVLCILPMLHSLLDFVLTNDLQTREVAFADDLTVAGKLAHIKSF